ncbi:MAG: hypothetical protein ACKVUT_07270 [Gaiella sp.]
MPFDDLARKWSVTKAELREFETRLKAARTADRDAMAAEYSAGRDPEPSTKHETAVLSAMAAAEVRFAALGQALDAAGNALADAIGECRGEWIAGFETVEREATERYQAAIGEAIAHAGDIGLARAALAWLSEFDVARAHAGAALPFTPGALRCDLREQISVNSIGQLDAVSLLRFAAAATNPPKRPTVAVEEPGFDEPRRRGALGVA